MSWADNAACQGEDRELFFVHDRRHPHAAKEALSICATCPVKQECLEAAIVEEQGLGYGYRYGIRGGTTPTERWVLSRRTPRACAECGRTFVSANYRKLTCSKACADNRHRAMKREWTPDDPDREQRVNMWIGNPDDPRHGSVAGYVAHRKGKVRVCDDCREANNSYKRNRIAALKDVAA